VRTLEECSAVSGKDPRLGDYWRCLRLGEFPFPPELAVGETERTKYRYILHSVADTEHLLVEYCRWDCDRRHSYEPII